MEQHYATMDDVIKALARMALKTLREKGGEKDGKLDVSGPGAGSDGDMCRDAAQVAGGEQAMAAGVVG